MVWQTPSRNEIGIWLTISGNDAQAYLYLLEAEKAEIHAEMKEELQWIELSEHQRNRICLHKSDTDPLDENDWAHQFEWFTAKLELFDKVFRERIRGLDAADLDTRE